MNTNELQSYFAQQIKEDRNQTQGLSSLIDTLQTQSDYAKCYKPYRTLHNYWYYGLHNWPPNGYRSVCLCILLGFIQSTLLTRPVHKVSTISPIVGIFCYYIRVGEIPQPFHSNFFSLCVRLNSKWTEQSLTEQTGHHLIPELSSTILQTAHLFFYMVTRSQHLTTILKRLNYQVADGLQTLLSHA